MHSYYRTLDQSVFILKYSRACNME